MDFNLFIYHLIYPMLDLFKGIFGNYGWSIIAVTVLIKMLLYPLTKQQTQAMKKMQELQPKIKLLQERFNKQKERYKDRPEKMREVQMDFQKDMMEFYKENNANPLGGCFPMLIQFPILIAMFWAFNGSPFKDISVTVPVEVLSEERSLNESHLGASKPQIYVDKNGEKGRFVLNPGAIKIPVGETASYKVLKIQGNSGNVSNDIKWLLLDTPQYTPNYMSKKDVGNIFEKEVLPDRSVVLTAKEPGAAHLHAVLPGQFAKERFLFINGLGKTGVIDSKTKKINFDIAVLVALFALTIWLSTNITSSSSPKPSDPKQAEMQQMMQKMMPMVVVMFMLFAPVPAGVLLYFVASGLIQAIQTYLVMKPNANA